MMSILSDIWTLLCEMSPYLLLGFLLAGLMHEFIPGRLYSRYLSRPTTSSVVLAALFGVPLPLCSCGVIPTAMGLRREGASKGATVAFLTATPQTGVDSIVATYSLLGLPFALIRPLAALVTAIFAGCMQNWMERVLGFRSKVSGCQVMERVLVGRLGGSRLSGEVTSNQKTSNLEPDNLTPKTSNNLTPKTSNLKPDTSNLKPDTSNLKPNNLKRLLSALHYAFVDMMQDIGRWLVAGLVVAGLITALVPDEWFAAFQGNSLLSILFVLALSLPMYLCATGSIPIAVALMLKGLTPGAAFVLLMAGPASNMASILVIRKVLGARSLAVYLASILLGAVTFGLAIDWLCPTEWFTAALVKTHACCHEGGISLLQVLCAVLLLLLLLRALVMERVLGFRSKVSGCQVMERVLVGRLGGSRLSGEVTSNQKTSNLEPDNLKPKTSNNLKPQTSNLKPQTSNLKPKNQTMHFAVRGMHCHHCAASVQRAVASLPGVEDVTVSLPDKSVIVEGHDLNPAPILEAIRSLGFDGEEELRADHFHEKIT